ncbi:hypothetical protein BC332_20624 [Capsicum chinense]|nr:hypothetical protein BC332_20624 [Capsicum chinense]
MVERLKDACMLEAHKKDFLKMHDVVRDFAISKENSSWNEHNYVIQAGIGLAEISHIKVSSSVRRISCNEIECLPDCLMKFPETTSLLLQDNEPHEKIPHEFFLAFPAQRVLNLSGAGIRALPSSINSLRQLHALIIQNFHMLTELPPIGKLHNLKLLYCDITRVCCLPPGMDKLTNLKVLNLPVVDFKNISKGFFLKLSSIEMLNMLDREMINLRPLSLIGATCFDEISSQHIGRHFNYLLSCSTIKATRVNTEIPRVQKLVLRNLPKFGSLGEPQSMWEHLKEHEVINCDRVEHQKLPPSILTTNVKVKKGVLEWLNLQTVSGDMPINFRISQL